MCELCGKHLKSSKSLASHREIHFARKYCCDLCKRAFHFKDTLRKHMNSHLGLRDYQCEYCAKAFKLHSTLQAHINVVHLGSVKEAFTCIVCNKRFHKKDHYDRHTRTHTGERPYACELCEWKFANVFNLRQHKISIHKVMPFPCLHCADGFKAKKLLAEHCVAAHAIYI
jgi:KRAB domain-containing zinc finger protein